MGRLGWTESDFRASTIRAIIKAIEGHSEATRERDLQDWKRTRLLAFFMLQPYSKDLKEPKDLFLLDEEKPTVSMPQFSQEEIKALFDKWDAQIQKKNAGKNSGS